MAVGDLFKHGRERGVRTGKHEGQETGSQSKIHQQIGDSSVFKNCNHVLLVNLTYGIFLE